MWRHNSSFARGTPTDDTSQNILIIRAIVAANHDKRSPDGIAIFENNGVVIDTAEFARRIAEWVEVGHREHNHPCGLGCGRTTCQTLARPEFLTNPIAAAQAVWEDSGRVVAPNGSVMRIASSGCFGFWDEEVVREVADKFGRATHADPRCVFCAVGAAVIISRLIRTKCGLLENFDLDGTLQEVLGTVPGCEEHRAVIEKHMTATTLAELHLSGNKVIGYCLKAFGSAIWALRYCETFEAGIEAIEREGGDADTNAAVVGALLGAKFGWSGIRSEFLEKMFVGHWLWRKLKMFMNAMGMEPPPSIWL
jgi:ADP-ribosylglycohydrolase